MKTIEDIRAAKQKLHDIIKQDSNYRNWFRGIGISSINSNSCIKVLIRQLSDFNKIPNKIDDIDVIFEVVGDIIAL